MSYSKFLYRSLLHVAAPVDDTALGEQDDFRHAPAVADE